MWSYSYPGEGLHFYVAVHTLFTLRIASDMNVSVNCKENRQEQLMEVLFLYNLLNKELAPVIYRSFQTNSIVVFLFVCLFFSITNHSVPIPDKNCAKGHDVVEGC